MYARSGMGATVAWDAGSWCGSWPWNYLCSDAANKAAEAANKKVHQEDTTEYGDIRDRNEIGLILCKFAPWDQRCMPPPSGANDPSNYGGHMSKASKDAAQAMYLGTVANDCASHPELYTEIPGSCSYREPTDFTTVALVLAGIAALSIFKG